MSVKDFWWKIFLMKNRLRGLGVMVNGKAKVFQAKMGISENSKR